MEEASTSNNSKNSNEFINRRNKLEQEKRDWYQIGNYHRASYTTCKNHTGRKYHHDKCKQAIKNVDKLNKEIEGLEKEAAVKRNQILASLTNKLTEKFKNLEHPD